MGNGRCPNTYNESLDDMHIARSISKSSNLIAYFGVFSKWRCFKFFLATEMREKNSHLKKKTL